MHDEEIYAFFAEFNMDNVDNAVFLLRTIWGNTPTVDTCSKALRNDPRLYAALKSVHAARKSYDAIRNWSSFHRRQTPIAPADAAASANIRNFLKKIDQSIASIVNGGTSLETAWSPEGNTCYGDHISNLRIPALGGKPCLLLHNLGELERGSVLQKRLKNIFLPKHHTFFVNTSGSGKTHILFEGLCDNWGFYFTSEIDGSCLGSKDVQNCIRSGVPEDPAFHKDLPSSEEAGYEANLADNRAVAKKRFHRIFLARLLVFSCFVEKIGQHKRSDSSLREYRKRWLLLQLHPEKTSAGTWDIFDHLSSKLLSTASDYYINAELRKVLARVRRLCARVSGLDAAPIPFFCVLDEAQSAATQHMASFRSDTHKQRPILREIIRAWSDQDGVFMIVAGTRISGEIVDPVMTSAAMKPVTYRRCSDTGAFDKAETQRQYLAKYLPELLLESVSGKRLLARVWYWLHGRHRFTAAFVEELIQNDFQQPHRLLNVYVKHFTGFSITDASAQVQSEKKGGVLEISRSPLDFSRLPNRAAGIHRFLVHYFMRSTSTMFSADEAAYVEYGFARYVGSEAQNVKLDEPLVLLAGLQWMDARFKTFHRYLAQDITHHSPDFNGWEDYVAFCLDRIFSEKRCLDEAFIFYGKKPLWATLEAEIVTVHRLSIGEPTETEASVAAFGGFMAPSITLGVRSQSVEATLSWLAHGSEERSPFCFPERHMGLFILRLSNKKLLWVALQAEWSRKRLLLGSLASHAIKSVTPSNYFKYKNNEPFSPAEGLPPHNRMFKSLLALPNRGENAGEYSLLRVIASYPADSRTVGEIVRKEDKDKHPIATLNMELVKQVTEQLEPEIFLTEQASKHQILNQQEGSKRKRGHEANPRPKKKMNLNK